MIEPFSWLTIGRHLRPLTGGRKTYARRGSKRFRVYKFPRPREVRACKGDQEKLAAPRSAFDWCAVE